MQKSLIFNLGTDYEEVANGISAAPKEGLGYFDLRDWPSTFRTPLSSKVSNMYFASPFIVVLGHKRCGAVTASVDANGHPHGNIGAIIKTIAPGANRPKKR